MFLNYKIKDFLAPKTRIHTYATVKQTRLSDQSESQI